VSTGCAQCACEKGAECYELECLCACHVLEKTRKKLIEVERTRDTAVELHAVQCQETTRLATENEELRAALTLCPSSPTADNAPSVAARRKQQHMRDEDVSKRLLRLIAEREAHLLTVLEAVSRATSLAEAQRIARDELNSYAGEPVEPPGPRAVK